MPKLTSGVPVKGLKAPTIQSILIQDTNGDGILSADELAVVTFVFSTNVIGFDRSDVTVTNGSLGALSTTDGGKTWRGAFTPSLGIEATAQISIGSSYTDAAGNVGTASKTPTSILVDTKGPTLSSMSVTDASGDGVVRAGETAAVTFTFSERVSGFDRSDIIVTGGTVDAISSADGGITWKGVFTPATATEAVAQISVAASYTDLAGNAGTASKSPASILVDTRGPTIASLSITDESGDGTVRAGETATVKFAFSEKITGFDSSDVTVTNGSLGPISSSDGGLTWTGKFTPLGGVEALAQLSVGTNYYDLAGNSGSGSKTPSSIFVDSKAPVLSSILVEDQNGDGVVRAGETAAVTFTFSEKVTGFDVSDVTTLNGSLGSLSSADGGKTWKATFTPAAATDFVALITVAPSYTDLAGNPGTASTNPGYIRVDTKAPAIASVVWQDTNGDGIVSSGETARATLSFNEKVTSFDLSDLAVTNGTLNALSSLDGGLTWTVGFTPTAGTQAVAQLSLSGSYTDLAGNAGTGSPTLGSIQVDTMRPSLSKLSIIDHPDGTISPGQTALVSFAFTEKVTGFDLNDLTVSGGSISALTTYDAGQNWLAMVTPATGASAIHIDLANSYTDLAGNVGTAANREIYVASAPIPAGASTGTVAVSQGSTATTEDGWATLKIGAGGYLTGIDIARDGTKVIRTDTYGAYLMGGDGTWKQLVTATSMPGSDMPRSGGVYEIQVADSNSKTMYMSWQGDLYKTLDAGDHWNLTNLTHIRLDPNDQYRTYGQKMAIDPNNSDVVVMGTQNDGLFLTRDGGATWTQPIGIPKAQDGAGITGILFYGSNVAYAASSGNGVYKSIDGGRSWSQISGGPTTVENAAIDHDGNYYAVGATEDSLFKYSLSSNSWTSLHQGGGMHAVAIDPLDNARVIVANDGGSLLVSHDGGGTWGDGWNWGNRLESSADVPWLENSGGYMSSGGLVFDPSAPTQLYQSAGVGVWKTNTPANDFNWATQVQWTSQSKGIEQLCVTDIIAPSGGSPVVASWDRAFFKVNGESYPDTYSDGSGGQDFSMGWSLDYASSNPTFVVGISDWWGKDHSGYSTDGGQTWHAFAGQPASAAGTIGGSIAASTPKNIVWSPANSGTPAYTLDGGATWTDVSLPEHSGGWSLLHYAYYLDRTTVAADRVAPNTFYLYDAGSGLYRTNDGGPTWEKVFDGLISPWSYYQSKIEAAPFRAGELYFTAGPDSDPYVKSADNRFMHSVDGGHTWSAVDNVTDVLTFGFGKPSTEGGPATIDIVGFVGDQYGIWQSEDGAHTWTRIGVNPVGSLDNITTITGDMNNDNVYVGFGGSGAAYWVGHDGVL